MTDQEVNNVIAEYMGCTIDIEDGVEYISNDICQLGNLYTESLDALVPVWERLFLIDETFNIEMDYDDEHGFYWKCYFDKQVNYINQTSPQQAAAHATAKAIIEINKTN